jgi:hypothetical protein
MQQKLPPAAVAAVLILVFVLVSFVAYKTLATDPGQMDAATIAQHQAAKQARDK